MTDLPESTTLISAAKHCLQQHIAAVCVQVVDAKGSTPRVADAAMLVTADEVIGTIGGGHLEWVAVMRARELLGTRAFDVTTQRFALGASLGQCCGGSMTVSFSQLSPALLLGLERAAPAFKTLYLFGAGHVACAIVKHATGLPVSIVWVDSRDQINTHQAVFLPDLPEHYQTIVSDAPEAELTTAKAGDLCLVMTHSHALDELLIHAALQNTHLAYIGLIGSATKKKLFEQRLERKGVSGASWQRVTCPIGISMPTHRYSKDPTVIALNTLVQIAPYL